MMAVRHEVRGNVLDRHWQIVVIGAGLRRVVQAYVVIVERHNETSNISSPLSSRRSECRLAVHRKVEQ